MCSPFEVRFIFCIGSHLISSTMAARSTVSRNKAMKDTADHLHHHHHLSDAKRDWWRRKELHQNGPLSIRTDVSTRKLPNASSIAAVFSYTGTPLLYLLFCAHPPFWQSLGLMLPNVIRFESVLEREIFHEKRACGADSSAPRRCRSSVFFCAMSQDEKVEIKRPPQ